ncbi:Uncharacterized protein GY17_00000606 [Cryptosporidium hominis]|uniref:Uncharacterized protein n=1 Tax=Cryptosporidium hominis TaxID=237895 RepID=A0ABX5BKC9_CRYHO|nr:Uncharacterized protein GY17_00000606 [Cryptosporidium hominis]|eukprot:PPS98162.1 Uncharacterized protein GY17_00000606 [Cryptosporidium hominis]
MSKTLIILSLSLLSLITTIYYLSYFLFFRNTHSIFYQKIKEKIVLLVVVILIRVFPSFSH